MPFPQAVKAAPPAVRPTAASVRPLPAFGAKARANNRGLARKRYTASYARGVARSPRGEEETYPVMEEINCGEKENSPDLPPVSQKSKSPFFPLVERIPLFPL